MRRTSLTKAAGWILSAFGAVHMAVTPFETRSTWSEVAAQGWWNTFTLDTAVTLEELRRSEAFWVSAGSFGVPLLALGGYVLWSAHRGAPVPTWLGWVLLAYGTVLSVVVPASPAWAIAVAGLLLVVRGREGGRPALSAE